MMIQCATCINEQETITQIKRILNDLGIPGEFNLVYGAFQGLSRKYKCPDYFPILQFKGGE